NSSSQNPWSFVSVLPDGSWPIGGEREGQEQADRWRPCATAESSAPARQPRTNAQISRKVPDGGRRIRGNLTMEERGGTGEEGRWGGGDGGGGGGAGLGAAATRGPARSASAGRPHATPGPAAAGARRRQDQPWWLRGSGNAAARPRCAGSSWRRGGTEARRDR